MTREVFQVNITGPNNPAEVPVGDLAELLIQLERSILSSAKAQEVELPEQGPVLSLVDIREGSDGLVFSVPATIAPAVALISQRLYKGDLEKLPREVHCELYELSQKVRGKGWGLAFVESSTLNIVPAEITLEKGIPSPPPPLETRGDTTLLVRCLRVGGVTPKAEIRLRNGDLLYPYVSEDIARQLGKRLYDEVAIKATATWRTDNWKIVDLRITAVSSFRKTDPDLAFQELATASNGRWEEVDAREYVRTLRDMPQKTAGVR